MLQFIRRHKDSAGVMQRIKTSWTGQFSNILAEYHQFTKKLMTDSSTMSEGESFRVFLGHFITTMESVWTLKTHYFI